MSQQLSCQNLLGFFGTTADCHVMLRHCTLHVGNQSQAAHLEPSVKGLTVMTHLSLHDLMNCTPNPSSHVWSPVCSAVLSVSLPSQPPSGVDPDLFEASRGCAAFPAPGVLRFKHEDSILVYAKSGHERYQVILSVDNTQLAAHSSVHGIT